MAFNHHVIGSYAVTVHAGAHCAGAAEFQRFLGANRRALSERGYDLAYPARNGAEGGQFDVALPEPKGEAPQTPAPVHVARVAAALDGCRAGGTRGLILSDDDLPGSLDNLLAGRFYGAAGLRAATLRAALGQAVDRLILVVQPYDDLFRAAWRRQAIEREVAPFARLAAGLAGSDRGWVEVVEELREALGANRVTVLAGAQHPATLLSHAARGLHLPDHVLPAPSPEPTDSAVAMIQRHIRMGAPLAPGQRDRLLAFHARLPQTRPAQDFESLALADMRGRYVADMDTLSRMAGVDVYGDPVLAPAAFAAE